MLDDLLKDIKELQDYKYKYECQAKDKQRMSDMLYKLMTEKYEKKTYEERCELFRSQSCSACRFGDYCEIEKNPPEDIWKPIRSDEAWIPGYKSCGKFEWS